MKILDIPYVAEGERAVLIESNGTTIIKTFDGRKSALAFAVSEAVQCNNAGQTAMLSIQGADGLWRAFNPRLVSLG